VIETQSGCRRIAADFGTGRLSLGCEIATMDIMKTEPIPSDREVLAGLVERVTYQNADNGFCVIRVKARGHRDLVTSLATPP